ncbi:MAG: hypothetical protein B6I26_08385 [Desulfobacteraceae bacterium 4572_130]|nr:MAG: hypothetical protein B6I26_08385 [Desulfobacteraceae bacterium 4572_130]
MENGIKNHYTSKNLKQRIIKGLEKAKKNPEKLELKDLSLIDQLHTGGHLATLNLAKKININKNSKILDAGCGIGGSSRLLAKNFKCFVTGIDLVDEFINAAEFLTKSTNLDNYINFHKGNILNMNFNDNSFDYIWCQHSLMNIKDKKKLFLEFKRVLKPKGKLIFHEVFKGKKDIIHLPVPWASMHSISFLITFDEINELLKDLNFTCLFYEDLTINAEIWWEKVKQIIKISDKPKALGPYIIFGKNSFLFGNNMTANLQENRIKVFQSIYTCP